MTLLLRMERWLATCKFAHPCVPSRMHDHTNNPTTHSISKRQRVKVEKLVFVVRVVRGQISRRPFTNMNNYARSLCVSLSATQFSVTSLLFACTSPNRCGGFFLCFLH